MILPDSTTERNLQTERNEIEWLKTGPDRVFLYVRSPTRDKTERCGNAHYLDPEYRYAIITWLGTVLAQGPNCYVGRKVPVGGIAGPYAYKRSVDCRIFGIRYVGWYYESAGDYCRLRKAKVQ